MNEPTLHIYITKKVPLTRARKKHPLNNSWRCFECLCRRQARNLVVQDYYDGFYVWCKDKDQCKQLKRLRRKGLRP